MIQDVSDTAYWVAHYRALENERSDALFRDPLAQKLVGERGRAFSDAMGDVSRYTEWSVVSRTVIIDRFIAALVGQGVDTVVNLGAGLDTRPYRMDLPEALEWIEVDCPKIIAHKNQALRSDQPRCRLTRFEVDLTDARERRAFLESVVPQSKRALILTEGVIPYLSPEQVADLARDLLTRPVFAYWIAEYFHPRVYRYLKRAGFAAAMRNAPFRFYPDDWYGFFRNLGWAEMETRYSGEVALEFRRKPPMPKWAELLMPFLPKRVKEESLRASGHVVFRRV